VCAAFIAAVPENCNRLIGGCLAASQEEYYMQVINHRTLCFSSLLCYFTMLAAGGTDSNNKPNNFAYLPTPAFSLVWK